MSELVPEMLIRLGRAWELYLCVAPISGKSGLQGNFVSELIDVVWILGICMHAGRDWHQLALRKLTTYTQHWKTDNSRTHYEGMCSYFTKWWCHFRMCLHIVRVTSCLLHFVLALLLANTNWRRKTGWGYVYIVWYLAIATCTNIAIYWCKNWITLPYFAVDRAGSILIRMEYELEQGFSSTKWDIWILVIYPGDYQTVHIIIQWFIQLQGSNFMT